MTTPSERGRWQERTKGALDALDAGRSERHSTNLSLPPEWTPILQRAAAARGLNTSAFVRRAAMAIAVHDLGLDWLEVMSIEPRVRLHGEFAGEPQRRGGTGHGPWQVSSMQEAEQDAADTGDRTQQG